MNLNKAKLDNEQPRTQLKHRFTFATEVCYNCTRLFYSYKTARACSDPHSEERRLSLL